jgi:asparagine synthase (glutamine-hydrolysing)
MCGVVAVAGARVELAPALAALAHRGPDGRGAWYGDGIALGHTRLAIVDPAGGAQPIGNEDGSIVAVVNGELYGFEDERRYLAARGHTLRTRCDAEVLVHLYEELGDDIVRRLRGELAFVLWDARRRRLLAARDRFGVKPLVWARLGDGIALASEAKALFALGVSPRWDVEAFAHAAHVQYLWPDRTLFRDVRALEPGHVLIWDGDVRVARYWDLPRAASGDVRAAIEDAVRVRLRADAPACVQLSGGVDSTTVATLAAPGVAAAFTVTFPEAPTDELVAARATARELGLPLHEVVVDGAAIARDWIDAVVHGEGLAINGHLVAKWRLSRAMRAAGFKVALTGEGADELFAGYAHLRRDAGVAADHEASRGVMLPDGDALPLDGVRARLGFVPTWLAAKATLGLRVRSLLARDLHVDDPCGALVDHLGALGGAPARVSATAWIRSALAGYILRTLGDAMEMAHGIEGRVPFLDERVANAAFARDDLVDPALDKPVLRRAMAGVVRADVLARGKQPFLAPPLSLVAPQLVQDLLRAHARSSPLVDRARLVAVLDALPAMPAVERRVWDPALALILSAAAIEARYCR